jgi:hypothetical protein
MNVEQLEKVLANLEKKVLEGNVLVEEEGRD